ncbi:FAS1-like dehydratase domain-containing protein [Amycolatopsis pigmentata]|uniref:MaoC family dehydratase N-terminal domain-containing protein n=1 Tax=Amycolatopsis pigmentata TaxID=450801 RepID=A0ABW5FP10_9PSEU
MSEFAERTELLVPEPAHALGALLEVPVPDLTREGLPPLWHWVYLLDRPPQADLGADGHPVRGTIPAPPGPGLRRMWAGGQVRTHGPLRCGEPATRRTEVLSIKDKQGRTGPVTFVVVGHRITQLGRLVVDERQDLVYRAPAEEGRESEPAGEGPEVPPAEDEWGIDVTPTLLFRFSALTYNAHRIHYDRDYVRDVEGYPGLLTHGPLQALAMAEAARAQGRFAGNLSFDYRLTAPLFDHQGLIVRATPDGNTITTAVRDVHGRQTAQGSLTTIGD